MLTDQHAKKPRRVLVAINFVFALIGLCLGSVIAAPQLLAFPHQVQSGATRIYAESPIDIAKARQVLQRADARLATSPLHDGAVGTRIFLTDGGWRWRLLALSNGNSLGFTRPVSDIVSDAVILRRGSLATDSIRTAFGARSLSGVIAHERTHIMVRRHLGMVRGVMLPGWISEGYADHVAGDSTLNAGEYARLRATGANEPAMFYFEARRRVEAALAANGNDVDGLLAMR